MTVRHLRIDNRLIVSHDEVAADDMQRMILPPAARGVPTSVLGIQETFDHCASDQAQGESIFVIHGANDPRVPLSEAEQIKAALDERGVPCEMRVYHDEGHGLAKRANRLDAYPAAVEFLEQHLLG